MVQIPRQIDLLSLMVDTGVRQAFFIDAAHDLLVVEPHDPTSWGNRFVAWICGWSYSLRQHALREGWLPVDIAPAHLITGLHEALQVLRPTQQETLTHTIRERLAQPGASPVAVARSVAGLVANPTPPRLAIAQYVGTWSASDSVQKRGVDAAALFKIRNFALLCAESDQFRDKELTKEWVASVVDKAAAVFFLTHNTKALNARINALPIADGTAPAVIDMMKAAIRAYIESDKRMRTVILDRDGTLEQMTQEAFEKVRAKMISIHLGLTKDPIITGDLAHRIVGRAEELKPQSESWPLLCNLPSDYEAQALLDLLKDDATANEFFTSTCTSAAADLVKKLEPSKDMDPDARESAIARKATAIAAAVKAVGPRLSQEERDILRAGVAAHNSPREVLEALVAFRKSIPARLAEYMMGERRIARAGARSAAQAALTSQLHAQGTLPSAAAGEFLETAKSLRQVLKRCGQPCERNDKGVPVLLALRDAQAALHRLQSLRPKSEGISNAEVQAIARLAARDLIDSAAKPHAKRTWTLDRVIHAFGGKQVRLLLAGLRSPELAGHAHSHSMQRLLNAVANALCDELLSGTEHPTEQAVKMAKHVQALPSIEGVSLKNLRPGIAGALRKHFPTPAATRKPAKHKIKAARSFLSLLTPRLGDPKAPPHLDVHA